MVTGFLVGGVIGGIETHSRGGSFWKGAAVGAATGAASGIIVDIAVATGGIGGIVLATAGSAILAATGNIADQKINKGKTWEELDGKSILVDAAIGGVVGLISFGVSGGSLKKTTGSVWSNLKKNTVDTLMEGTTKTISQNAVNKTTKVISTSAGKAVVRKTIIPTVVKKVAQNSAIQVANTAVISGAGKLASLKVTAMLM